MKISRRPLLALLLFSFCLPLGAAQAADGKPARPHIIFILADDLGPGDLGCYGGRQTPTPRLDQFATEGTRFTQYYSAAPGCGPSCFPRPVRDLENAATCDLPF